MRKIVGIGETILDIVFRNNQPTKAVPGGSVFNCLVSLSRTGVPVEFVSEIGQDHTGSLILQFMSDEHICTDYIRVYEGRRTAVSLAYLNERNDADYVFYKDYPQERNLLNLPTLRKDDILIIGSFYAIDPLLREAVNRLIQRAKEAQAIIYYDPNFRPSHKESLDMLMPMLEENFDCATVVRASKEDFQYIFGMSRAEEVYAKKMKSHCVNMICTAGGDSLTLCTPAGTKTYEIPQVTPVSTIGAGDNFNAGFLYGLMAGNIGFDDLASLEESRWDEAIGNGLKFSAEVCCSYDNYISTEFARTIRAHSTL